MEQRSVHEKILAIDCQHKDICEHFQDPGYCLQCMENKDTGNSYFIDRETYAWYRKIRGE